MYLCNTKKIIVHLVCGIQGLGSIQNDCHFRNNSQFRNNMAEEKEVRTTVRKS
jgi:hypothetical protein